MMSVSPTNMHKTIRSLLPFTVVLLLTIVSVWPLLVGSSILEMATESQLQLSLALLIPFALLLSVNDMLNRTVTLRSFALIAIFTSLAVALRPLGLGVAGLEPIWVAIIMAGYTLGVSAGFTVGGLSILLSALITGGVGPWLGNQMVLAALIGVGAAIAGNFGAKRLMITLYAAVSTYFFGWFMNLWFWPTFSNLQTSIAFDPTSNVLERMSAWAKFSILTSTGFDIPRALLSATLVWLVSMRLKSTIERLNAPISTEA